MKTLKREYQIICDNYPLGSEIIFDSFEFDKLGLNAAFYMKKGVYTVKKYGFFSVGDKHFANLYLDKGIFLQIIYREDETLGYFVSKIVEKHFLRNSFDKGFWLGSRDERGFMFYDDYFYGRDTWKFFGEFLENVCARYFKNFTNYEEIEYNVEDAYCSSNIIGLLIENGYSEDYVKESLQKELQEREWIIDFVYEDNNVEIYYHFNDNDLEKRFEFVKNSTYLIKMVEKNRIYDKKIQSSMFKRNIEDEFYEREYLGITYEEELSVINLVICIPIDITDFRKL